MSAHAAIRHGFVVAVLDLDREIEHLTRPCRPHEPRLTRQRGDRPPAKSDVRHRHPRRELTHRLGHETRRERRNRGGYRKPAASARAGHEPGDPVDEREGREVIRHPAWQPDPSRPPSHRAAPARRACRTFRGEEPRNVGDLHRRLEPLGGHLGQVRLQLRHAHLADDALLLELGLGQRAARVLDDLAARDLDLERALEPEHHVEEVDRFRVEPLDQRHVGHDVLDVAAERVGHRFRDGREYRVDLFLGDCFCGHAFPYRAS